MNDYSQFLDQFKIISPKEEILLNEPLAKYTTWRVGGPADLFYEVKSESELIKLVGLAREMSIPFFMLGGGANILVGDKGYRGLVIKNAIQEYTKIEMPESWKEHSTGIARHAAVHFHYYDDTENASYGADTVFYEVSGGYSMPHFIRDMFKEGNTGLEWFVRIPGTLGGWIYNNVHGHTIFIGDFIHSVRILTENNQIVEKFWNELDFGYDYSVFHTNKDIVLSAQLRLFKGNVKKAQEVAKSVLVKKNEHQPANSAGCVFHNVSAEDKERCSFESDAVGYVVDKKFGWLGQQRVGGAWISVKHGNFIETDGTATAHDVLAVMDVIKKEFKTRYNIDIKEEVFRVGEF